MNPEEEILELENRKKTFWSRIRDLSARKEVIISVFRKRLEEKKLDEVKRSIIALNKNHDEA